MTPSHAAFLEQLLDELETNVRAHADAQRNMKGVHKSDEAFEFLEEHRMTCEADVVGSRLKLARWVSRVYDRNLCN